MLHTTRLTRLTLALGLTLTLATTAFASEPSQPSQLSQTSQLSQPSQPPVWSVSPAPLQYTALTLGIAGTALVIARPEPLFHTTFSPRIDERITFTVSPTVYSLGDKGAQGMLLVPYLYYLGARPTDALAKSYVYTESLLLMHGITTIGKYTFGRQRPEGGNRLSFPSGHSAQSFMVASWLATDLYRTHQDSPLRYAYAGAPYLFAGFVGVTRIGGGKHYFTDVVAGALLGSAIGYAMYNYHFDANANLRTRNRNNNALRPTVSFVPDVAGDKYTLIATFRF